MSKKGLFWVFLVALLVNVATIALAQHNSMVQRIDYLSDTLLIAGRNNFPPFSDYKVSHGKVFLQSVFLKPLQKAMKNHPAKLKSPVFNYNQHPDLDSLAFQAQFGEYNLFIGAYADTKEYKGLDLIYPAVVSNPIHIITLPENAARISDKAALTKFRGLVVDTEIYNNFSKRKIKELNAEHVATPLEAYEKLFTKQVDYIIGGLYYHRIMSSQYGLDPFLSYSKKPLFKIPVFVAMSKTTPKFSLYQKAFQEAFADPAFGNEVKKEILQMVEDVLAQNRGIVPPAFAQAAEPAENKTIDEEVEKQPLGHIIEQKVEEKTFDEVLEGI